MIVDKGNSQIRRLFMSNYTMSSNLVSGVGLLGNGGPVSSAKCNSPQDFVTDGAGGWLVRRAWAACAAMTQCAPSCLTKILRVLRAIAFQINRCRILATHKSDESMQTGQ